MIKYRLAFEFRCTSAGPNAEWRQHSGLFEGVNPIAVKNAVVGKLRHMGYETRGYAAYEGELLVLGAPLPIKLRTQQTPRTNLLENVT